MLIYTFLLQFMSIIGDIPVDEPESRNSSSTPLPPLPTPPDSTNEINFSDEVPPAVPKRTLASHELVEEDSLSTENTPEKANGPVMEYTTDGIYEQPTPCRQSCHTYDSLCVHLSRRCYPVSLLPSVNTCGPVGSE